VRGFLRELAWDLRGNRSNAGLSFLALCVAMCSFVLVSVSSHIGTDALVAHSEQVSGRPVTMQAGLPTQGWSRERIAGIAQSIGDWRLVGSKGSVVLDHATRLGEGAPATLRLTVGDYRAARRIMLTSGRWFSDSAYPGEVVINRAAATALAGRSTVDLELGYKPAVRLSMVGVVSDGLSEPMLYASAQGVSAAALLTAPSQALLLVHTTAPRVNDAIGLMNDATNSVGIRDRLEVSRVDEAAQIKDSLSTVSSVFLLVSLTGLVVAIIGMINVGIASVRERARDFTIRRAMGATRARIVSIVAASTVVIGIGATLTAIGLSYAAVKALVPLIVNPSSGIEQPAFPWLVAGYAAAGGILASLVSGLAPAIRTRTLDLAALLRE
jgi:putative ABC transport system permease protein